jgi:hypothetical protein
MVHNGLLVAQGNYKEQSSLKDFLMSEMGESLEEGLEEFIERLDGLEGALDPQKLKDKMKNLDDLKDFIPTPAKIVPFHSEADILLEEGDIYCVGSFKNMANANLSINSFPIIYQARYREQEIVMVQNEIEQLISQIEKNDLPDEHFSLHGIDIEQKIIKDYLPLLLYSRKDTQSFETTVTKFRSFLVGYAYPEDIDHLIAIILQTEKFTPEHYTLLELYAKKITAVCGENVSAVEKLKDEIAILEKNIR